MSIISNYVLELCYFIYFILLFDIFLFICSLFHLVLFKSLLFLLNFVLSNCAHIVLLSLRTYLTMRWRSQDKKPNLSIKDEAMPSGWLTKRRELKWGETASLPQSTGY